MKLRLTGGDRVRFLNGQVTNDVRKANAHLSMPACVLSAKGKIDAFVFIHAGVEDLVHRRRCRRSARRCAAARSLHHRRRCHDRGCDRKIRALSWTGETAPILPNEPVLAPGRRFGTVGWDLLVAATEHDRVLAVLSARRIRFVHAECARTLADRAGRAALGLRVDRPNHPGGSEPRGTRRSITERVATLARKSFRG